MRTCSAQVLRSSCRWKPSQPSTCALTELAKKRTSVFPGCCVPNNGKIKWGKLSLLQVYRTAHDSPGVTLAGCSNLDHHGFCSYGISTFLAGALAAWYLINDLRYPSIYVWTYPRKWRQRPSCTPYKNVTLSSCATAIQVWKCTFCTRPPLGAAPNKLPPELAPVLKSVNKTLQIKC